MHPFLNVKLRVARYHFVRFILVVLFNHKQTVHCLQPADDAPENGPLLILLPLHELPHVPHVLQCVFQHRPKASLSLLIDDAHDYVDLVHILVLGKLD